MLAEVVGDMPNWAELTALCAFFTLVGAAFLFTTRSIVRDEIRKINGTYMRTDLANEKFKKIDERFAALSPRRIENAD